MTAHITINDRDFGRAIKKTLKKLDDRRSFFAQAAVVADKMIQDNFRQEGALFEEGGWTPLALSTKLGISRTARGGAGKKAVELRKAPKILQDKGKLKSQWKHMSTARFAKVQSGVEYGAYHHYGSPKRNLPKRQILPEKKDIMPKLWKLLQAWVKGIIK